MPSKSPRKSLPFEPKQNKKKTPKQPPIQAQKVAEKPKNTPNKLKSRQHRSIPEVVSQRMIRRMVMFSGIPTALGLSSFGISYWIVSHQWFELPHVAVLLVTLLLFGLGVLGLSYGVLSTSWDEERVGGWWGWQEFTMNFGRMTAAWRSAKEVKK